MAKRIYLDNTATTCVRTEVRRELKKYFHKLYANPSSIHLGGLMARGSIEMARERIAATLNCASDEIIFTGSGSEANNLAIRGAVKALKDQGNHIITSPIEHKSVLSTCRALKEDGFDLSLVPVDGEGKFDLSILESQVNDKTVLVSLGYINNEIGTVQEVEKAAEIIKRKNPGTLVHFDAVQALPYLSIDADRSVADMLSFSGHKLYAPKGIGFLYLKKGLKLSPQVSGGEQEWGVRSGTENVPYIVGLSRAVLLNKKEKDKYCRRLTALRDILIDGVLRMRDVVLTGPRYDRAPNHASFAVKDINGKMLVKALSQRGYEVSSGSACSSPRNDPSHVLSAIRVGDDYLMGGLRVTLGMYNTKRQVKDFLKDLALVIKDMRDNSPIYNNEAVFISKTEFEEKRQAENCLVLDVRPLKYPRKEIPGTKYVPFYRLGIYLRKVKKDTPIIVICYQGDIISPWVRAKLVKKGYTDVKVLKGGIFNYFGTTL